jgi:hypothetical protein
MIPLIRRALAVIWLALPPFVLSALVHLVDPDVNGWKELGSSSVAWSVAALGVLVLICFALSLEVLLRWGRWAFLAVSGIVSMASGLVVTAAGSGAATTGGLWLSFAACTAIVFLAIVAAVIPAAVLGWPRARSRRRDGARP